MRILLRPLLGFLLSVHCTAWASGIDGTVVIKRKLTKRKVTLDADGYQRGTAVALDSGVSADALAFEKSHVAIFLEGQLQAPSGGTASVPVMEQKNRTFVPDLLVIPPGSAVSFPNLDPIFHNVFSLSKPKSFDLGNYPVNQTRMVTFHTPGIVLVNCHLHPNMSGTIVVSPTAWFARTSAEGNFSLPDVPPGRYTVVAWHRSAGFFRKEVTVSGERDSSVEFFIPLDDPQPGPNQISSHPATHAASDR